MTHKKETPEPAPKKAAPKKAVKKKVVKKTPIENGDDEIVDAVINRMSQRIAEEEPVTTLSHTLTPAATVVTTTEEYQPPKIEDLHAEFGHKDIPHQIEEEVKERATGVWSKVKTWWNKYAWIVLLAVLFIAGLFAKLYYNKLKEINYNKETQKEVQKIEDGKSRLAESEANLNYMQRRKVDSAINNKLIEAANLMQEHMRADERTAEENVRLKNQLYAMQEKIRTASADTLIELGRQDARKGKD